jgi:hypothetical protein
VTHLSPHARERTAKCSGHSNRHDICLEVPQLVSHRSTSASGLTTECVPAWARTHARGRRRATVRDAERKGGP